MVKFRTKGRGRNRRVIPIREKGEVSGGRHITDEDRLIWRRNALIGEKIWENTTPRHRKLAMDRPERTEWQFIGRSPHTINVVPNDTPKRRRK
ncbi:MAG: hypothetical protein QXZ17_14630 [Nitrososphaerota archaeon]